MPTPGSTKEVRFDCLAAMYWLVTDGDSFGCILNIFLFVCCVWFMVFQHMLAAWSCVWTPGVLQLGVTSATSCTTSTSSGITRLCLSSSLMGAACLARLPRIMNGGGM